jgi:preprotein translocase subunit SecE
MASKDKRNPKKRRPKGRPLSEKLGEKGTPGAPGARLERDGGPAPEGDASEAEERDEDELEERDEDDDDADEDDEDRARDEGDERPAAAARADAGDDATTPSAPESAEGARPSERGDDGDDGELAAAAEMGHTRYVMAGFFGAWVVGAYVLGRLLEAGWGWVSGKDFFALRFAALAAMPDEGELVSRESISLVLAAAVSAVVTLRYYYKPSARQWTDEVAEEMTKVKWPTRKEVGNNTVVVIVTAAVLMLVLGLLDRVFGAISNIVYAGA